MSDYPKAKFLADGFEDDLNEPARRKHFKKAKKLPGFKEPNKSLGIPCRGGNDGTTFCYGWTVGAIVVGYLVRCEAHPRYQALRRPTSNCPACATIWRNKL